MPAYRFTLSNSYWRDKASELIARAPEGYRVTIDAPKRTNDQNEMMWALLADIATQCNWHGRKLASDDWKLIFLSGLRHELRVVPNYAGDGFIPLGFSSSRLSKEDFSNLIELILAYGAKHGVKFNERDAA